MPVYGKQNARGNDFAARQTDDVAILPDALQHDRWPMLTPVRVKW
jgi:hypothetical protein